MPNLKVDPDLRVNDLIDFENREWDVNMVRSVFSDEDGGLILSIPLWPAEQQHWWPTKQLFCEIWQLASSLAVKERLNYRHISADSSNFRGLSLDAPSTSLIYGPNCNPWDVLDDSSTPWIHSRKSNKIKTAYVFTRLDDKVVGSGSFIVVGNNLSLGSGVRRRKQYVKIGDCGSWNGLRGRMPIKDNNKNVLGIRRELNFRINDISGALWNKLDFNKLGHYKLDEFALSGCDDYALCRITLDTSKTPKVVSLYSDDVSGPTKMLCT
ncbi:hypothetical protein POM88_035584 [Heracleum sosnowskyi]|uniref:Uncharacterized protein n=1 Tax=Heracleum sosnowskyi TaxID=360622 RepID=A0AAD8HNL6_9APIA|nr:hypothetical protein POM88_035584 [Heracleum sosnowskyi]